jgi:hypothetical protein
MDKLLAKLSEQSAAISKQTEALKEDNTVYFRTAEYVSASSSVPMTPATENFNQSTAPTTSAPSLAGDEESDAEKCARLARELEAAKGQLARMGQELAQTAITKHTIDQAMGSVSEADFPMNRQAEVSDQRFAHLPSGLNPISRPRDNSWAAQDDAGSDTSDALSAGGFNRARAIWDNGGKPNFPSMQPAPMQGFQQPSGGLAETQWMSRGFGQPFVDAPGQYPAPPFREQRMMPEADMLMAPPATRRNNIVPRFNNRNTGSFPYAGSNSSYDGYTPTSTPYGSVGGMGSAAPMGMGMSMGSGMSGSMSGGVSGGMFGGYQPQPIGTPLSPHAPEFTSSGAVWKTEVGTPRPFCNCVTDRHVGCCFRRPDFSANY